MKRTTLALFILSVGATTALAAKSPAKGPNVFYRLSNQMRVKAMPYNTTNRLRPLFTAAWAKGVKTNRIFNNQKRRRAVMATFGDNMYITDTRGKNGAQTQEWGYQRNKTDYFHGVVVSEKGVNREVLTNTSGKIELLTFNTAYPGTQPERKAVGVKTAKQLLKTANSRNGKPHWKLFFK